MLVRIEVFHSTPFASKLYEDTYVEVYNTHLAHSLHFNANHMQIGNNTQTHTHTCVCVSVWFLQTTEVA